MRSLDAFELQIELGVTGSGGHCGGEHLCRPEKWWRFWRRKNVFETLMCENFFSPGWEAPALRQARMLASNVFLHC